MAAVVIVITPPDPIVTFEDVSKHIIDVPAEDKDYVESLIAAATAKIDGPRVAFNRALGVQLLEWQLAGWPCNDTGFPIMDVLEIESVKYVDPVGAEQTWTHPTPLWFENMPMVRGRLGDVRIRYWAGYGERDGTDPTKWTVSVPPQIKIAIMMLVAQWYRTREAAVIGDAVVTMPFAVDELLDPFRVYR